MHVPLLRVAGGLRHQVSVACCTRPRCFHETDRSGSRALGNFKQQSCAKLGADWRRRQGGPPHPHVAYAVRSPGEPECASYARLSGPMRSPDGVRDSAQNRQSVMQVPAHTCSE